MSKWIIVISYALILFHNNYYYISLFHNIKHKPSSPHLFYCILSFHCYKGVHYCFSRPPTWKWSVFPAPSVLAGSWPVWCLPWPPPQCLLLVFKQCSTPILVKVYDGDLVRKVAGRCSAWCLPWPPPPVPAAVLLEGLTTLLVWLTVSTEKETAASNQKQWDLTMMSMCLASSEE